LLSLKVKDIQQWVHSILLTNDCRPFEGGGGETERLKEREKEKLKHRETVRQTNRETETITERQRKTENSMAVRRGE
jgi:hypothetical protein